MRTMPILPVLLFVLLLAGLLWFLSSQADEVPTRPIETEIPSGDAR